MKNLIVIIAICFAAFTASAQLPLVNVGTYPGDPSGEQIGHQLFVKLNYDLSYLYNLATNQAAQIAALQAQGQPASMVQSSTTVSLLNSNPFVFTGSNYLGSFTNVFSLTCLAGTNALTNMMSVDGGISWLPYYRTNPIVQVVLTNFWTNSWVYSTPYYVTNSTNSALIYTLSQLGTNFTTNSLVYTNWISGPVQLAVLSGNVCTGSVNVASLADPSLEGRYYDFAGETLHISQVDSNTAAIADISNKFSNAVTNNGTGYTLTGTWYGDGTWLLLNGTNLAGGTVNSNALDSATLTWLQSVPTPGVNLLDNANSSGGAGQYPLANGDGTWTWQTTNTPPAIVIPDTGGMGGTTIMLNAQDNGTPMYIHVTSLGVVTATGSP